MLNQTYLQLYTQENNLQQIEANSNQTELVILFAGENFVRINEFNFTYFRKSVPKISFRIRNANFRFIEAN